MLHKGKKLIFFGWFHLTIYPMGAYFECLWVVSGDGKVIGRVTYLVYPPETSEYFFFFLGRGIKVSAIKGILNKEKFSVVFLNQKYDISDHRTFLI